MRRLPLFAPNHGAPYPRHSPHVNLPINHQCSPALIRASNQHNVPPHSLPNNHYTFLPNSPLHNLLDVLVDNHHNNLPNSPLHNLLDSHHRFLPDRQVNLQCNPVYSQSCVLQVVTSLQSPHTSITCTFALTIL